MDTKDRNYREEIFKSLEKKGAIHNIEKDFYEKFLNHSDRDMELLMRLIFFGFLDDFNRMCEEGANKGIDEKTIKVFLKDIERFFKERLHLISEGVLLFRENGDGYKPCISKPTGNYPPSPEIERKLWEKIENATPLITEFFLGIFAWQYLRRYFLTKKEESNE